MDGGDPLINVYEMMKMAFQYRLGFFTELISQLANDELLNLVSS